jgi:OOP family OmpA-OmpF porin
MTLRNNLLVATLVAAPLAAQAQPISGIYVGVGAGVNFLQDETLRSITTAGPNLGLGGTRLQFDPGYRLLASVGYGLGNGWRVEVEGDYFHNSLSGVGGRNSGSLFGNSFQSVQGAEEKWGGFVNAIFDIDLNQVGLGSLPLGITPYVGAGAGYLVSHNQNVSLASPGQILLRNTGTDGNFAYQGILGVALPIEAVPGLALTLEYRFVGIAGNRDLKGQLFAPGVATRARLREGDDFNHSIVAVAVRYAFNHPPPPFPVPVAPPRSEQVPSRTYLVFFDWDRADLTERARQIIAEAAAASTRVQTTRIRVQGNTDRSGTPAYNQALSLRRARAVAAELVRHGVAQAAIDIQGLGDTRPLVPTSAGVREPQNRRVEIVLR